MEALRARGGEEVGQGGYPRPWGPAGGVCMGTLEGGPYWGEGGKEEGGCGDAPGLAGGGMKMIFWRFGEWVTMNLLPSHRSISSSDCSCMSSAGTSLIALTCTDEWGCAVRTTAAAGCGVEQCSNNACRKGLGAAQRAVELVELWGSRT